MWLIHTKSNPIDTSLIYMKIYSKTIILVVYNLVFGVISNYQYQNHIYVFILNELIYFLYLIL